MGKYLIVSVFIDLFSRCLSILDRFNEPFYLNAVYEYGYMDTDMNER